jgi:hypothetical protein
MPTVSGEQRFQQDISKTEKRYSGKWSPNTLADYCWNHIKEAQTGEYETKKMKWVFNDEFFCS